MAGITDILTQEQLDLLRDHYDDAAMVEILSGALPAAYGESFSYVRSIETVFFDGAPSDWMPPPRNRLSDADRERVVIALLTAGDGGFFLALHIYIALMLLVSPAEVAHIILLAAIYSGVSNLAQGLAVHGKTLGLLAARANDPHGDLSCGAIYALLKAQIPS